MLEQEDVVELIRYEITPEEVFLDGPELRNYEITFRRAHGETLEEIAQDYGLTREAIRQIVQKTYGPGFDLVIKERKRERQTSSQIIQDEVTNYILTCKGIRVSELQERFTELKPELIAELKPEIKKYVDFEREAKSYTEQWSDQQILNSIAEAGTYFFPLSRNDYEDLIKTGEIIGPSGALIMKRFGTWAMACSKAGIESHRTNLTYTKKWSEREQSDFIVEFLESEIKGSSMAFYETWKKELNPHAPSSQLLRNTFGGWLEVISTGLRLLREEWDKEDHLTKSLETNIQRTDQHDTRH